VKSQRPLDRVLVDQFRPHEAQRQGARLAIALDRAVADEHHLAEIDRLRRMNTEGHFQSSARRSG
jgi:hypothetical protein